MGSTPDIKNPQPTKAKLRDEIVRAVLAKHRLEAVDFFSRCRNGELTAARRDAANQLKAAGFTARRIGVILKRDTSTIEYYLHGDKRGIRRDRARMYVMLRALPKETMRVVMDIAEAEGCSPYVMVREWVAERAMYEAEAKARAA